MIRQWQPALGGWRLDSGTVSMRVLEILVGAPDHRGRWAWTISAATVSEHGHRTYKTAAGARAACERVARRLGVVS